MKVSTEESEASQKVDRLVQDEHMGTIEQAHSHMQLSSGLNIAAFGVYTGKDALASSTVTSWRIPSSGHNRCIIAWKL
jgi:hypothetical protein